MTDKDDDLGIDIPEPKSPWPRTITGIEWPDSGKMLDGFSISSAKIGDWCSVRAVKSVDPEEKTRLGIYLGSFAMGLSGAITKENVLKLDWGMSNPAILVPSLNRIVRGYESWWGKIKTPEQLRTISDQDINDVWYVQALKSLTEPPKEA